MTSKTLYQNVGNFVSAIKSTINSFFPVVKTVTQWQQFTNNVLRFHLTNKVQKIVSEKKIREKKGQKHPFTVNTPQAAAIC